MSNPEKGGLSAAQNAKMQIARILGFTDQKHKAKVEDLSDEEFGKVLDHVMKNMASET